MLWLKQSTRVLHSLANWFHFRGNRLQSRCHLDTRYVTMQAHCLQGQQKFVLSIGQRCQTLNFGVRTPRKIPSSLEVINRSNWESGMVKQLFWYYMVSLVLDIADILKFAVVGCSLLWAARLQKLPTPSYARAQKTHFAKCTKFCTFYPFLRQFLKKWPNYESTRICFPPPSLLCD